MAEFTDERSVLVGDLEIIQSALSNAIVLASACDIQSQVLQLQQRPRVSRLAAQLNQAQVRVEGYLLEGTEDETDS